MRIVTINGSTGTEFGELYYGNPSWATVRAATTASALYNQATPRYVGLLYANSVYYCNQFIQGFDLSSIPSAAQIVSATISFSTINDDAIKSINLKGFKYDFVSADVSDYLSATEFAAMTPVVSYQLSDYPYDGYVDFIDDSVPLKNVLIPGEMNRFIFVEQNFIAGVAPTDASSGRLRFQSTASVSPPRIQIGFHYPSLYFGANF